jgi:ketosteroid isomerase-like protein
LIDNQQMRTSLIVFLLLVTGCATVPSADPLPQISAVLDDWHKAASEADEARYFGHMTPNAVFLGTDDSERWDATAFREYAHPHFAKGKGWTFVPHDRHIALSPRGDTAWFDEKLDSASYGPCRGSGVLQRDGSTWKLAHYNLTIPIPNDLAKPVVQMIRDASAAAATPK